MLRISSADLKKLLMNKGGEVKETTLPSKLRNIPGDDDGYHFDSQAELRRYWVLRRWSDIGVIRYLDLEHKRLGKKDQEKAKKHRWTLIDSFTDGAGVKHQAITYTDDFQYSVQHRGIWIPIVEDFKGWRRNPDFVRTEKMFRVRYPDVEFFINQEVNTLYAPSLLYNNPVDRG